MIGNRDKCILRELARRISDIAADPIQEARKRLWREINGLKRCRMPLLVRFNGLFDNEVVPDSSLVTADPVARMYEHQMRLKLWQWENVCDDCVTEPVVNYDLAIRWPRRIAPRKVWTESDSLGAYRVIPVIEKESDIDRIIEDSECSVDWDATARRREWVEEVFDGILRPAQRAPWLGCAPFDYLCEIRGMENVFMDMHERPEWLEEIMRRLYELHVTTAKYLEHESAFVLNNNYHTASNGGHCYTDELPAKGFKPGGRVRLKDIWGHSTAQATVSISPEMHERFITRFERDYHALFGLTGVGCCETVDRKMHLHRMLPNLRRVSVSAWNDFARAAGEIGADYVYSLKPSAASISLPDWNVEKDMAYLEGILDVSRNCHVEIIHSEIVTCLDKPERLAQWSMAAKKLVMRYDR